MEILLWTARKIIANYSSKGDLFYNVSEDELNKTHKELIDDS